jgi:hypothetical protein
VVLHRRSLCVPFMLKLAIQNNNSFVVGFNRIGFDTCCRILVHLTGVVMFHSSSLATGRYNVPIVLYFWFANCVSFDECRVMGCDSVWLL